MVLCVAVDFDGVLNTYDGWRGRYELFEPRLGAGLFLSRLNEKYDVVVFTNRDVDSVWRWLEEYNLVCYVKDVTNVKPRAFVYVDDRACKFVGDYERTLEEVNNFTAHWESGGVEFVDSD